MKTFILISFLILTFQTAFAGEIECKGKAEERSVLLKGSAPGPMVSQGTGSLSLDGEVVANFEAGDMSGNMLDKSFKFENNQGDIAEGKFDNYMAGLVTISRLEVQGKLSQSNVRVKCKTK